MEGPLVPAASAPRTGDPLVSLVVPVLNEELAIPVFVRTVEQVLGGAGIRYEVLFVDDGSTDGTPAVLAGLTRDPRYRAVVLSRNFGKEAALSAGLDHASGDVVVPIDVDLQDPPDLVPQMLARWREGFDVVYGVREDRRSDARLKRWTSGWFYRVFNLVAETQIPPDAGDFRLIDRRVVEVLKRLPERSRFMKGLFAWVGFRAVAMPFERQPRAAGSTKWRYWRLWNFALDGLTGFSTAPLRIWTYIGGVVALLAFLYATFIVVRGLVFGNDLPGYASLMTVILFLGGVQLVSLGVIGEYLGRLFKESKQRPLYVVAAELPPSRAGSHGEPVSRTLTEG